MAKCSRCGKKVSVWQRGLESGLCPQCRSEDAAVASKVRAEALERGKQENARIQAERWAQVEAENARRLAEAQPQPIPGVGVIAIGVVIAIIGGLVFWGGVANRSVAAAVFAKIILAIAWFVVLAGVIRWAVSGSNLFQLNRMHRQNLEMLDLLEIATDKGGHSESLDGLREQMERGQLSHEEYRKRRRELLRDESGGGAEAT